MRRMRERVLALLLTLVMLIGLLPTAAFAADGETIYVLAGGDFQAGDNGQADHYYSRINMGNILDKIKATYSTMNGFLFVGDYDGDTHNDSNANAGVAAMMEEVSERYSNLNHDNSVLIEGNHETGAVSGIDATGGYEFDGYAVYAINETDYCERQTGKGTQIQTVADNLETWLNNKLGEGYDAPIFVITHVPLAYGTRTYTNGDGLYAKYVFDVLNTAADNGLNIIFLHGHDHAYGADNYLGGEAIYLAKGDKINIAEPGNNSDWTEETLNFTYMNAGYVGYYNENYYNVNSYEAEKLTMTVFAIENDKVTVERISKDGTYNLKSAGREGFYNNSGTCAGIGLSYNTTVYASPQTIALQNNDNESVGTIGEYVGVTGTLTDDVTTSGGSWVEIIAPVEGTPATEASTTYKYVLDTDGVNAGGNYLILNTSSDGTGYALTNNDGTAGPTEVTISNGEIVVDNDANINWVFSNATSGTVSNTLNNRNYYLSPNNGSLSLDTNSTMTISNQNNGAYKIYRTASSYYYYLRYNNGWTGARTRTWNGTNGIPSVYLFAYDSTITTEGTPAVPGTNGTYNKLVGDLTYEVAVGTSADDALAAVKVGLSVYEAQAMSAEEAGEGTKIEGAEVTVEWIDEYKPTTAGDYAVKVSYNGKELGTAEVVVPASTTYYIAEGNGMYYVDMNATADAALAAVKAGITVYSADDTNGTNKKAIYDDDVTWTWVDNYNGADSGPYTVEILYNGTSLGTVEVKVNVKYETGIETDWTYIGETEATGGQYTYTLDTDGIDYGEAHKYIIVDDNQAIVLNANSSSDGTAHSIAISGNTATTTTRDYEYHVLDGFTHNGTAYHKITKGDGSQYLYQESNGVRYGTRSSVKFQVNHHGSGIYDIHDIDGTNWYIIYNGSWTVTETTSARVRLYKYTGTTGGTPGGPVYALIEGNTVYTVAQGSSATKALAAVKAGITGYTATAEDGTGKTEIADSDLTWKWKNTFNGNSTGSYWVEISYQGKVLGTVEVRVEPGVVNNYPEYPDEGSVKVSKTGTGIDFQSSGIAQVEISASGVPIKKGADVIVMLDTSSSMTTHNVTGSSKTRAQVLEESLKSMIAQFKTPGADGQLLDLRVAIADFNGFYGENHNASGTPYDRDAADMMSDDISYNANSEAQVYTGDRTLGAGAFIPVEDLAASYTLNYTSGTNYDYAMDAIYQMGTAIKEANGSEERDLYVIFMSDGAAMQWNYYHSQGASSLWNYWITGAWTANQLSLNCNTHAYYYDEVDHNGDGMRNEHRMANAIKGDPSDQFEVIRKVNTLGTPTDETNMYMVPGLGAKMFSISFDAQADTNVTEESMDKSIASLASEQTGTTQYYYKVTTAAELDDAFDAIGSEIAYAAYNARFVDQMGDEYNLQMKTSVYEVVENGAEVNKTLTPKIEIISYDIYTRQDYLNGTIAENKIGDRKGTYKVLETVTFNADGTKAYSDQIGGGTTNILADGTQEGYVKGVIYAKTFIYNTNATAVAVEGVSIPTGTKADGTTKGSTNLLPSETFYWKLGTVQTSELAMRYYVYLEGSMEGTRDAGSYPTNEYATLYYDNYLNNPCKKDTVSPVMAWKSANVSYAFYLVNENGEIIVNQTTGQTGSFANKIAVTNPVVYKEILLNNTDQVNAISVSSSGVLPTGYDLFDSGAVYEVTIESNSTGGWKITNGGKAVNSTYVMHYDPENAAAYSNELSVDTVGNDYTHTVVWFAVVWKVQALPDTVVIDYGLPVDISVLANDMFGENGTLAGVGAYSSGIENTTAGASLATGFGTEYKANASTTDQLSYGDVEAYTTTGKVRYTLNTMEMNGYDNFAYAVKYANSGTNADATKNGYYYDTVTVIPATTIYYEDSFLTYSGSGSWMDEGAAVEGATQAEDRPGQYSLTDANNIYGYDAVNNGMATFSLGTAKKVHVDADSYATAEFTFCGTGFDVIGMTSNATGVIAVQVVTNQDVTIDETVYKQGTAVKSAMVNTYYGYTYADGQWIATPDTANALYQVPVMQIEELPYGSYTVTITATYAASLDKTTAEGYDLYLDAIRIYDPAGDGNQIVSTDNTGKNTTIADIYVQDGEGWPSYIELRNKIIAASSFDNVANEALTEDMEGLVFIDGDSSVGNAQISDYVSYGPNNEVYLAPGQSVAFLLNTSSNIANVHIGIKSADGKAGTYTIKNIAQAANSETGVEAGDIYGEKTYTVDTTTDMYYDLTGWKSDIIVISNTGDGHETEGIISLTNIKSTYTSDPNSTETASEMQTYDLRTMAVEESAEEDVAAGETTIYMTPAAATLTLRSLNAPAVEEPETPVEPETPDEPETPEEPETPVEPEQPEEPEVPQWPSYEEIVETVVKKVINTIKSLFGWLFK